MCRIPTCRCMCFSCPTSVTPPPSTVDPTRQYRDDLTPLKYLRPQKIFIFSRSNWLKTVDRSILDGHCQKKIRQKVRMTKQQLIKNYKGTAGPQDTRSRPKHNTRASSISFNLSSFTSLSARLLTCLSKHRTYIITWYFIIPLKLMPQRLTSNQFATIISFGWDYLSLVQADT